MISDSEEVILTTDLKKSHLPIGTIGWNEFSDFALTFDPRVDQLSEEEMAQMGERDPKESHTLRSLRARLYNWQRILNNQYNDDPSPEFYQKVSKIIGWMAVRLS